MANGITQFSLVQSTSCKGYLFTAPYGVRVCVVSLRASFGRGAACFFHSASLRKKSTAQFATLSKHRASPGHPWPVLSRILAASPSDKRRLSDAALATPRPRPPPGGSPPGSAIHNRCVMHTYPGVKPHPAALTRGRPSTAPVVPLVPGGMRSFSRCIPSRTPPPLHLRLRSGGSQILADSLYLPSSPQDRKIIQILIFKCCS